MAQSKNPTRLTITLSPELAERLAAEASKTGVTKSAIVALSMRQYFQMLDVQPMLSQFSQLLGRAEALKSQGGNDMSNFGYDMAADRLTIDGYGLHSGDPVIAQSPAGLVHTRVESDSQGWYLVDFPTVGEKTYSWDLGDVAGKLG